MYSLFVLAGLTAFTANAQEASSIFNTASDQTDSSNSNSDAFYLCVFGPDSVGNYYEDIVQQSLASTC